MANVNIKPIPLELLEHPVRLWPQTPPIFDGPPTAEDIELARELFSALDPDSKTWYRCNHPRLFGDMPE